MLNLTSHKDYGNLQKMLRLMSRSTTFSINCWSSRLSGKERKIYAKLTQTTKHNKQTWSYLGCICTIRWSHFDRFFLGITRTRSHSSNKNTNTIHKTHQTPFFPFFLGYWQRKSFIGATFLHYNTRLRSFFQDRRSRHQVKQTLQTTCNGFWWGIFLGRENHFGCCKDWFLGKFCQWEKTERKHKIDNTNIKQTNKQTNK